VRILVTGGCGYVGSRLIPSLMQHGHDVLVVDHQWFGNFLPVSKKVEVYEKSVLDLTPSDIDGVNAVIHLANIANDPSVELNQTLSWETNVLGTLHLLELSKKSQVQDFIYSSSGSVYGVKSEDRVTEELELIPISLYNKTKMIAERVVKSYEGNFRCISIRPATVCGYSPRMRLDVLINMFAWQAFSQSRIQVLGGDQIRPNVHIDDLCDAIIHFLIHEELPSGAYNVGFENISVKSAATLVSQIIPANIEYMPSVDPRSYRQDSTKLLSTGFKPTRDISIAIQDLKSKFESGQIIYDERWFTVPRMKALGFGV
jgi:nucleoside-diphosphate-sugar epimerase